MYFKTIVGIALLQLSSIATAASTALSIYQDSSTEIRVEQISVQIHKGFANSGVTNAIESKDIRGEVNSAISEAYQPKYFEMHITQAIARTLSPREQQKCISG